MSETVDTTVPGPLPVPPDSDAETQAEAGLAAQPADALGPTAATLAEAALTADSVSDETFMVEQVEVDEPDLEPLPEPVTSAEPATLF